LAETQADGTVKEAVITVPSYFTQEQRMMIIDAADLAGLNVNQLVHENTAAATMYGIDRSDGNDEKVVLFYNMGARDTEVSVVRYSPIEVQEGKKNKTFEHIEILGEGFDKSLGGKAFDHVLVQMLVEEFNGMKERQDKPDVRMNDRAMKRLYKEIVKIKEVLSANRLCDVKIPELLDYVTLQFKLERAKFEERAESLFNRVEAPIQMALQ
jgi:hypoxia up-regulated 1